MLPSSSETSSLRTVIRAAHIADCMLAHLHEDEVKDLLNNKSFCHDVSQVGSAFVTL